jgi:transposase
MTTLFDFPEILIEQIHVADEITLTGRITSPTACCPSCGTVSRQVQSHYRRTLHDLPFGNRPVSLMLEVRRFFCKKSPCRRKIFTEQLPKLFRPHAQRTTRLQEALYQLGQTVGGQSGARLGTELGISGSRDTILRLLHQGDLPVPAPPHVVGVDEWAWKRGRRYGTLLCDLERGIPIDVLPDRSVESVSAWFKSYPSIQVISRDRSSEFAAAASKGAPQAVQVADRWHVGKNLGEALSTLLARCRADKAKASRVKGPRQEQLAEPTPERSAYRSRQEEQARLARKAEREQRYERVRELHRQGVGAAEIASEVGMGERTVRDWLAHESYPEPKRRRRRPSSIDRYEAYVLKRWKQGSHNGAQLYRELRTQGYRGSQKALYRYLARLRPVGFASRRRPSGKQEPSSAGPLERLSSGRSTWLFLGKSADLSAEEREELIQVRQERPEIETAYQLVQTFMQMLRERTGQDLEKWLKTAEASNLPEFETFAAGVRQDQEAVFAGLTLPWNNGPTEGQVTRLKLLKRSMYGRAKFDLLRLRVLHRTKTGQKSNQITREVNRPQQKNPTTVSRTGERATNSQYTTFLISRVA